MLLPVLAAYVPGDDPLLSQAVAFALFQSRGGTNALTQVDDRALALRAARQVLRHEDPRAIGAVIGAIGELPEHELAQLMPDILDTGSHDTPSNIMFMMGARLSCLELVSRHHIEEAIGPLVEIASLGGWGYANYAPKALRQLAFYGPAAADHLPVLREARAAVADNEKLTEHFDRAIEAIAGEGEAPETVTLEAFVRRAQAGTN